MSRKADGSKRGTALLPFFLNIPDLTMNMFIIFGYSLDNTRFSRRQKTSGKVDTHLRLKSLNLLQRYQKTSFRQIADLVRPKLKQKVTHTTIAKKKRRLNKDKRRKQCFKKEHLPF